MSVSLIEPGKLKMSPPSHSDSAVRGNHHLRNGDKEDLIPVVLGTGKRVWERQLAGHLQIFGMLS